MVVYCGKESAGGAVAVGNDMLSELPQPWAVSASPRLLTAVGITGSTNPGDFKADLVIGEKIVATLYNTTGGANVVPKFDDIKSVGAYCGRSAPVQLIVRDISDTNPIYFELRFKRWNRRRRTTTRRYGRRYNRRY